MAIFRLTPVVLAVFLAFSVHAEEATLPVVSVTAKGYASNEMEVPVSTRTVSREELAQRGGQNLGDTLRGEPGIAISNDSAQGQNPVIRGLARESIVLLVDGMRLNSAQPVGAIASFMSMNLAEQVEIVRGTGSVLYGTGAIGGVINARLPQAKFDTGTQINYAANYDSNSSALRGTGVIQTSHNDHAIMLGGSLANVGDYHSPEGKVNRTGYDSESYIGQYRYRLNSAQQLRASFQQHTDRDVWYPGSTKTHPTGSTTVHDPKQERRLYEIGYNHKNLLGMPLNLDFRFYRQEMERRVYSYANNLRRDIVTNNVTFATDGTDAKFDWSATPNHLLSIGFNSWEMRGNPDRYMASSAPFTRLTANNPFNDAAIKAIGIYAQDDMKFGSLSILTGARYDMVSSTAKAMNPNSPNRVTTGLSRTDQAWSGNLGVMYEVSPLLRPYINLAQGFRAPGMRERYESGLRGDGYYYAGSPEVRAETSRQFEIGLKGSTGQLVYAVSAYHTHINNYLSGMILAGNSAAAACGTANASNCKKTVNLGSVTLQGIEAQGKWQVSPGHWLSLGYSRIRGTNHDLGEALTQMPADEVSLGWQGKLLPRLYADTTLRLVDRQNRIATRFTNGRENATPGFVTADIGANWEISGKDQLRLAIRNVANRKYHEHLTEGNSGTEIKAPGRSIQLTWKGSF